MKECHDCGSKRIIEGARAVDRGHYHSEHPLKVAVDEDPLAFIFKQTAESNCTADICADCGYIGFHALSPETLWNAYQSRKKNVS